MQSKGQTLTKPWSARWFSCHQNRTQTQTQTELQSRWGPESKRHKKQLSNIKKTTTATTTTAAMARIYVAFEKKNKHKRAPTDIRKDWGWGQATSRGAYH